MGLQVLEGFLLPDTSIHPTALFRPEILFFPKEISFSLSIGCARLPQLFLGPSTQVSFVSRQGGVSESS